MEDGVKNVSAYGTSIVSGGTAVLDDTTFLEQATITNIIAIVGS